MRCASLVGAFITLLVLPLTAASAQGGFRETPIQFDFAPPSARSLGMGGAFIGRADDATAAESNPAGLTVLSRPEVSVHLSHTQYTSSFAFPVGRGYLGLGPVEFDDEASGVRFASVVRPYKRFAFSLYYQNQVDSQSHSAFEGRCVNCVYDRERSDYSLDYSHLGLGVAARLTKRVSIGATLRHTTARLDYSYRSEDRCCVGSPFPERTTTGSVVFDEETTRFTYSMGVLLNPEGKVSAGLVYKRGPKDLRFEGELACLTDGRTCQLSPLFGYIELGIPDQLGVGLALRPLPDLFLMLDVVHITYSDVLEAASRPQQATIGATTVIAPNGLLPAWGEVAEDGLEVRGGLEYVSHLARGGILVFRGGAYFDPDHDPFVQELQDSDQVHMTAGMGYVWRRRYQFDAGIDLGETVKRGIFSVIYRF